MIRLTCNKCSAALEMDDAFAGSTCRCQHCGTIQTVPTPTSAGKRAASPVSSTSRTLYAEKRRSTGTGLEELADVVTSSGLRQVARTGGAPATKLIPDGPRQRPNRAPAIILGAVGGVILGVLAVLLALRGGTPTPPAPPPPPVVAQSNPTNAPSFCGIAIEQPVVIYVIDRGSSARESLGHVIAATLQSIRTLGRDRRFQVTFWDNGQEVVTYPAGSPGYATPETIAAAARTIEAVTPFGRSDAIPAIRRAAAARPQAIVLITAKGWELDEGFVQSALLARGDSTATIHTVSIGGTESGEAMEKISRATGGEFRAVSIADLKSFARGD